jgi:hypothetical protein
VLIEAGNPFGHGFHTGRYVIGYDDFEDPPFSWSWATSDWLERELAGVGFETVKIERSSIGGSFVICHATKNVLP